jgi:hypothetical protein
MKTNVGPLLPAIAALALAGCASTQIKYDTRSLASKVSDIYQDETLENLARLMDDPNHVPSLADLKDGTVEADENFNPSVTFPFGNQVATTVVGTPGQTITAPSRAFTLGGSVGDKLILGVSPVNDVIRLRNTAAIYRYVTRSETDPNAELTLRHSYHFATKAGSGTTIDIDDTYLRLPQCVICYRGTAAKPFDISKEASLVGDLVNTYINPDLQRGWLQRDRTNDTDHYLGPYGGHELWETDKAYQCGYLPNLVMLLLPIPPAPAPAKSGT